MIDGRNCGYPQWGANRRTPNEKETRGGADAAESWPHQYALLVRDLTPLLQRRSLEKLSDGSTLVSPESSTDKFSELRARLNSLRVEMRSPRTLGSSSSMSPRFHPPHSRLIVILSERRNQS